jgi:hypothetical protein
MRQCEEGVIAAFEHRYSNIASVTWQHKREDLATTAGQVLLAAKEAVAKEDHLIWPIVFPDDDFPGGDIERLGQCRPDCGHLFFREIRKEAQFSKDGLHLLLLHNLPHIGSRRITGGSGLSRLAEEACASAHIRCLAHVMILTH